MADPMIVARAKELRRAPTGAEALLRRALLDAGEKLRRQFPIGRMIIDLALPSRNLLIEVDGGCHREARARDERRIPNELVFQDPAEVARVIVSGLPESEEARKRFRLACWVARQKTR